MEQIGNILQSILYLVLLLLGGVGAAKGKKIKDFLKGFSLPVISIKFEQSEPLQVSISPEDRELILKMQTHLSCIEEEIKKDAPPFWTPGGPSS